MDLLKILMSTDLLGAIKTIQEICATFNPTSCAGCPCYDDINDICLISFPMDEEKIKIIVAQLESRC